MSNKTRGRYFEQKTKKMLEAKGMRVELATPKIIWIKGKGGKAHPISTSNDFFGLFDGVAIMQDGNTLWFQVKELGGNSHGWLSKVRASLASFPASYKAIYIWRMKLIGKRKFSELKVEVI